MKNTSTILLYFLIVTNIVPVSIATIIEDRKKNEGGLLHYIKKIFGGNSTIGRSSFLTEYEKRNKGREKKEEKKDIRKESSKKSKGNKEEEVTIDFSEDSDVAEKRKRGKKKEEKRDMREESSKKSKGNKEEEGTSEVAEKKKHGEKRKKESASEEYSDEVDEKNRNVENDKLDKMESKKIKQFVKKEMRRNNQQEKRKRVSKDDESDEVVALHKSGSIDLLPKKQTNRDKYLNDKKILEFVLFLDKNGYSEEQIEKFLQEIMEQYSNEYDDSSSESNSETVLISNFSKNGNPLQTSRNAFFYDSKNGERIAAKGTFNDNKRNQNYNPATERISTKYKKKLTPPSLVTKKDLEDLSKRGGFIQKYFFKPYKNSDYNITELQIGFNKKKVDENEDDESSSSKSEPEEETDESTQVEEQEDRITGLKEDAQPPGMEVDRINPNLYSYEQILNLQLMEKALHQEKLRNQLSKKINDESARIGSQISNSWDQYEDSKLLRKEHVDRTDEIYQMYKNRESELKMKANSQLFEDQNRSIVLAGRKTPGPLIGMMRFFDKAKKRPLEKE